MKPFLWRAKMSLGENTKCDLSAGVAKIDFHVLVKQTENHYYGLLKQMQKQTGEVLNDSFKVENRKEVLLKMSAHGADSLKRLAEQIAETGELLYTLYNSDDREVEMI